MDKILELIASCVFWAIFGVIWYGVSDILKEVRKGGRR